jgi:hypothetical protein
MIIRGPIINGNAFNNAIARRLRAGADAYKSNAPNATAPNIPVPSDAMVMITQDAKLRYQEGLPSK